MAATPNTCSARIAISLGLASLVRITNSGMFAPAPAIVSATIAPIPRPAPRSASAIGMNSSVLKYSGVPRAAATGSENFEVYVWYTLQTHAVMERYMKHKIGNDPALTGGITHFLLRKFAKKTGGTGVQDKVAQVQAKVNAVDQVVKSLKTQVTAQGHTLDQVKGKGGRE